MDRLGQDLVCLRVVENLFEAHRVQDALVQHGISYAFRFLPTGPPGGLDAPARGWGEILVAGRDLQEASRILNELERAATQGPVRGFPWTDAPGRSGSAPRPGRLIVWLVRVLAILMIVLLGFLLVDWLGQTEKKRVPPFRQPLPPGHSTPWR